MSMLLTSLRPNFKSEVTQSQIQCQLLIGLLMSVAHWPIMWAAHWPTDISCSLANWHQLLIGQPMWAAHWYTDDRCSLVYDVSCLFAKWCQLLIGQVMSAAHLPTDIKSRIKNQGSEDQYIGPYRLLILLSLLRWDLRERPRQLAGHYYFFSATRHSLYVSSKAQSVI